MELSKADKRVARTIIEKGLQQEMANGLAEFGKILTEWKDSHEENRQAYLKLYKSVRDFDKHIATRYDNMHGSDYLFIIASQLHKGLIDRNDLENLSDDGQKAIHRILAIRDEL